MKQKNLFIILLFSLSSCITTYKYSKKDISEIENRIKTYLQTKKEQTKTIEEKLIKVNKISNEQPAKYGGLKNKSDLLQKNIDNLNSYINLLKKEIDNKYTEDEEYDFMCNTVFYKKILFKQNSLSKRGIQLKNKIDLFYKGNKELFSDRPKIDRNNSRYFDTNRFISDEKGNKISYLNFNLLDKPVVDILEYLEKLQLEINTFQYSVLNSMIQY